MKKEKKWEVLSSEETRNNNQVIKVLLNNRGIKSEKDRKEFFNPTLPEKITLKSFGIKRLEVEKAVRRIQKALKSKEKVIVYGDYDADGICGTAVIWEALSALGLNVLPYIPERFSEGYGLNIESIRKLKNEDPALGLIITVDHGIVAGEKVDVAKELGVDVIISDHHLPGKIKPKAHAIVHTTQIGGAAVAWVLAREVLKRINVKSHEVNTGDALELVAIGTIADQIPLTGANRSFVKYGLDKLNETKRPGLSALIDIAAITKGTIRNYEVGFLIAPRLNAMGRLEHAMESLRLLCTKNKSRADELAMKLNRVNLERQKIVEEVVLHAKSSVGDLSLRKVIVLANESYHEGVIGLAAGKLVEEFYRPAIVLSKKGEISKASARSITGFNIIEAIRSLEDLIVEGGGHPMAAGFSIKTTLIEDFSKKINEIAEPLLTEEILTRKVRIDMPLGFNQINPELVEEINRFEPTGLGNPTATFATRNVEVIEAKLVGRDLRHLKLKLKEGINIFEGIAFGAGAIHGKLSSGSKIDIVYNLEENVWNGTRSLQLKIKDLKSD